MKKLLLLMVVVLLFLIGCSSVPVPTVEQTASGIDGFEVTRMQGVLIVVYEGEALAGDAADELDELTKLLESCDLSRIKAVDVCRMENGKKQMVYGGTVIGGIAISWDPDSIREY